MNHRQQHDAAEASPPAPASTARQGKAGCGAVLVPFPTPGARRPRRSPRADERRGEILLFLGVRYERLAS